MRIVITGATGYLGSALTDHVLADEGNCVLSVSRNRHPRYSGVDRFSEAPLVSFDPAQLLAPLREFGPDSIVHLAGISSPRVCEQNELVAYKVNVDLSKFFVNLAKELNAYLCLLSSDWVFGGQTAPANGFTEEHSPSPNSVYGHTKCAAEEWLLQNGDSGVVLRSALIYGPAMGGGRNSLAWLDDSLRNLLSVRLFEDEWRTPVYAADVVRSICGLLEQRLQGIFHCAGPERLNRVEFGEQYARCFNLALSLIERVKRADAEDSGIRPEDVSLNANKISKALDLQFRTPEEAFRELKAAVE